MSNPEGCRQLPRRLGRESCAGRRLGWLIVVERSVRAVSRRCRSRCAARHARRVGLISRAALARRVTEVGQSEAAILTPREVAVLELVSEGQTNRAIAEALYISTSTAGVHVFNILNKLGAGRRGEAAGRAHTLGLLPIG